MQVEVVNVGAGSAHIAPRMGVCVVAYRGTMTLPLYLEAAYRTAQVIQDADCTAIYLGMDKALVAMTNEDFRLAINMLGPAARSRLKRPGACVTSEIMAKMAARYAWDAAQCGVERRAFIEPELAWEWALKRSREVRALRQAERTRPGFALSTEIGL